MDVLIPITKGWMNILVFRFNIIGSEYTRAISSKSQGKEYWNKSKL